MHLRDGWELPLMHLLMIILSVAGVLGGHAQDHADTLASENAVHHSNLMPLSTRTGGPCHWVGENIYVGWDPSGRWELYAQSSGHAAVLNHARTHHQSGSALMSDGRTVVVDVFCQVAGASQPVATALESVPTESLPRLWEHHTYYPI